MREDILQSCLGKWESTGLALFAPSVSVGLYAELNICLSSLLVCGRSAQHFAELSPAFAVLLVTVLGLEELMARWVLWCREVQAPSAAVLCWSEFFGELWQSWRLRLAFQIRTFFRKSEGVTNMLQEMVSRICFCLLGSWWSQRNRERCVAGTALVQMSCPPYKSFSALGNIAITTG